MSLFQRYYQWLHGRWPAGVVEKLPLVNEDGTTNVPGLYVAGDLRGIPLLKFSADTGARAVRSILADPAFQSGRRGGAPGVLDVAIVGAGVAGMSAALEARKAGLSFQILEASEPFSTLINFPKGKPIYTYPKDMTPAGELKITAGVKEDLVEELKAQTLRAGIAPLPARAESVLRKGKLLEVTLSEASPAPPGRPALRAQGPFSPPQTAAAGSRDPQAGEGRGEGALLARRVIVALGRSGNYRRLGVPGEGLDKVYNRLHDPQDYAGQDVLVVGGGDSALETAIALAQCGARVALSYRKTELSRPKAENVEKLRALLADPAADVAVEEPVSERVTTAAGKFLGAARRPGSLRLLLGSEVRDIRPKDAVVRTADGKTAVLPNDAVFCMIGREAPLEFFRRSGVRIAGEWTAGARLAFAGFLAFCVALYDWKSGGVLAGFFHRRGWFPVNLPAVFAAAAARPETLLGTLVVSASSPSFYYTLAYSLIVVVFGIRRIRRRRTPYVKVQTLTLMAVQVFPLFLLPEILLPWLGHNGLIPAGPADALFPVAEYGHGREYWRAYGFILAWPLMIYNVFTDQPLKWWLIISFLQTFVLIPGIIYVWGKGAYCGWLCSCGALAETLGDAHRHKMPHGPKTNRLNMVGQFILALAFAMLALRVAGWLLPAGSPVDRIFGGLKVSYKWIVDVFMGGVIGYGFYFWYSGRVWCRFLCPLAALMHVYARFSRFRILADKKKCISCNVCTSVCHQGIDVMNFANKGLPMSDPECVRCSACVQGCPTGVLSFGQAERRTGQVIRIDRLPASPVRMADGRRAEPALHKLGPARD